MTALARALSPSSDTIVLIVTQTGHNKLYGYERHAEQTIAKLFPKYLKNESNIWHLTFSELCKINFSQYSQRFVALIDEVDQLLEIKMIFVQQAKRGRYKAESLQGHL